MLGFAILVAAGTGCAGAPPSLLPELDGRWAGEVIGPTWIVPGGARFVWSDDDEALEGEVVFQEIDGERTFEVIDAVSVEELGVGLMLVERGGVHELYLDALAPLDPFRGVWRDEWYCGEGPTGICEVQGAFDFTRSR